MDAGPGALLDRAPEARGDPGNHSAQECPRFSGTIAPTQDQHALPLSIDKRRPALLAMTKRCYREKRIAEARNAEAVEIARQLQDLREAADPARAYGPGRGQGRDRGYLDWRNGSRSRFTGQAITRARSAPRPRRSTVP